MTTIKNSTKNSIKNSIKNSTKNAPGTTANAGAGTPKAAPVSRDDHGLRLAALRDLKDVSVSRIPDVRGWLVEASDGTVIGSVTRIILDQARDNTPRYLNVALDPRLAGDTNTVSNEMLVPIGLAQAAKDRNVVVIPTLAAKHVPTLPRLANGAISFAFEQQVAKAFGLTPTEQADGLYELPSYRVAAFMKWRPTAP